MILEHLISSSYDCFVNKRESICTFPAHTYLPKGKLAKLCPFLPHWWGSYFKFLVSLLLTETRHNKEKMP